MTFLDPVISIKWMIAFLVLSFIPLFIDISRLFARVLRQRISRVFSFLQEIRPRNCQSRALRERENFTEERALLIFQSASPLRGFKIAR